MPSDRFYLALGWVFIGLAVCMVGVGIVFTPVALGVVPVLFLAGVLFWYPVFGQFRDPTRSTARERARTSTRSRERSQTQSSPRQSHRHGLSRREARQILNVSRDASDAEIKRAYRKQVKATHPDQGGSKDEFQTVQQAYECLVGDG